MAAGQEILIRPLHAHAELAEAVALQQEIWGFADRDLLPFRFFVVASHIGGQVLGAFDGSKMVGFLIAIPGLKPGPKPYLHSHMLGVLSSCRNCGLGEKLKLAQKQDALARGIHWIEWTFDPLEVKNAYFNVMKLGAVSRRYLRNQYGVTSAKLNSGLPTDRLIADWDLSNLFPGGETLAQIEVPEKVRTQPNAVALQTAIADQFERHFGNGLAVIGVERTAGMGIYKLGKLPE